MTQQQEQPNGDTPPRLSTDVTHIKSLIDLMVENDLSRLELHEGETHILLRRGQPMVAAPAAHFTAAMPSGVPAAAAPIAGANEVLIRSPMVGTFYSATDPESPPFVDVGSIIHADTVVCLLEAMKVYNEIKAEVSGQITKVLVRNAEAVEFDQPLFVVAPA